MKEKKYQFGLTGDYHNIIKSEMLTFVLYLHSRRSMSMLEGLDAISNSIPLRGNKSRFVSRQNQTTKVYFGMLSELEVSDPT